MSTYSWSATSLITRPPPRSTLSPYTTLFRSPRHRGGSLGSGRRPAGARVASDGAMGIPGQHRAGRALDQAQPLRGRSEEHTSELQSHVNLVCRLLLEKKQFYCTIEYSFDSEC